MASNPWLAGVNVSKCPVCDVRLLNGSCIDHGPPAAEEVEDWPKDLDEPAEPETQPGDPKGPAEPEKPEEPQQQPEDKLEEKPEDKLEESQKKRRRKKTIVDTDSEDTPASDQQTEPQSKGEADEAAH